MQSICKYKLWWPTAILLVSANVVCAEPPYFVTYSHQLEEPGNLEFAVNEVTASPKSGNPFLSNLVEIEYGAKAWWTTELYLNSQTTFHDSTLFTGYKWENRIRPIWRELWINPVLYLEYADTNGADKTLREIAGHDTYADQIVPNGEARVDREHELELKLILSSNFKGWNVSENLIAEKLINHADPWEFGYALGISRPLGLRARASHCNWCAENIQVGLEMYGGLGDRYTFGLQDTSHYLAPTVSWTLPNSNTTVRFSPGFGLNGNSDRVLWRFTVAREIDQFGRLFRGRR